MSTEPTLGHAAFYPNPTSHSFAKMMKDVKHAPDDMNPEWAKRVAQMMGRLDYLEPLVPVLQSREERLSKQLLHVQQQLQQQHAALLAARDALERQKRFIEKEISDRTLLVQRLGDFDDDAGKGYIAEAEREIASIAQALACVREIVG